MTNFTSSCGRSRSRLLQSFLSDSPLPGHFTSRIVTTAARHARGAAVAAGFEQHRPSAIEQRLHQRIHVLLQQRLTAGHLHERAAKCVDLGKHVSSDVFCPSWNAYGVSHHEQRRSHAVRRTKTHGRPA